jgi:excisionase family DNA binding protein
MAKMFFSTSEVADLFNVNRVTIYRWVKEGMVKGYKVGKHLKIPLIEVERLKKDFGFGDIPLEKLQGLGAETGGETVQPVLKEPVQRKFVMAIDDDENILSFIESAFEGLGLNKYCKLKTYSNALEAVLQIGEEKPDLILLDIVMPNLNGLELAEKIRKMHRDIKIIILTGYPEYLTEDERGKFLDYMTKPVDVRKLHDMIVRALDINAEKAAGAQARA